MVWEVSRGAEGMGKIEVALPSWSKAALVSIEIDDSSRLLKSEEKKRVYVAFGDSISHGTGQGSASYKTWPFLLSRKLDATLYNLAVGGGKVSIPSADLLKRLDRVDVITLLIGYNDLNTGISAEDFAARYRSFLMRARAAQPKARIYCISPLYTRTVKSRKSDYTMEAFREAVYKTVGDFRAKDEGIILVVGDRISSEANLRENSQDPVHLGIEGARLFANEMHEIIKADLD